MLPVMAHAKIATYAEFWPFYLGEHGKPATRWFHFVGTHIGVACLAYAAVRGDWHWVLGWPVASYGFAWVSHFFIEKNRPATFTYPLWSLISDYRMIGWMWLGRSCSPGAAAPAPPLPNDLETRGNG